MTALKSILKTLLAGVFLLALVLVGALVFVPGIHISSLGMVLNVMSGAGSDTPDEVLLDRLQLAPGYHLSVFARGLENPRILHHSLSGRLLVTSPRAGQVIQLTDSNGDGAADTREVLLSGLQRPQGIEQHGAYLYIGESHQIGRTAYDTQSGQLTGDYEVIVPDLTDDGNHWSKIIRFDAEGNLYVAMGSTCNVCEEADPRRATIMRYNSDGSGEFIFASGLRNSVGLAFAPWNGALYATDNGRDLLGDNYPPCELNKVVKGGFYGWPYINGANELDPDFGEGKEALQDTAIAPAFDFRAHNAPLGIYFPGDESRSALVALHGSWNRSSPDGYRVVRLHWDEEENITTEDFLWGFEDDGDIVGRPVDITGDGEGGFFISDDYAGVVYRVSQRDNLRSAQAEQGLNIQEAPHADLVPADQELAAAGAEVYASLPCGDCHSQQALTPVNLESLQQHYTLHSLAEYFLAPTPPMPLFDLSEQQRRQLAHYLFSREQSLAEK